MKAIHFGAGNIGRGLIGQVLHKNHFEIVFLDTNNEIISQINQKKVISLSILMKKKNGFLLVILEQLTLFLIRLRRRMKY